MSDTYVSIKRPFRVIPISDDEVIIGSGVWSGAGYCVKDEKQVRLLKDLVEQVDGTRSLDDLVSSVEPEYRDDMGALINKLNDLNVLEISDRPSASRLDSSRELLLNLVESPDEAQERMRAAEICILGDGTLSREILRVLQASGFEGTMSSLKYASPDASVNDNPESSARSETSLFRTNVYALDEPNPALLSEFNRKALQSDSPWMLSVLDGAVGIIGPTFIPHQTACFECYEKRLLSNMNHPHAYSAVRNWMNENPDEKLGSPVPALAAMVAGWVAYDVIMGLASGFFHTASRQLRINLQRGSVDCEEVLRFPRCNACGPAARGHPSKAVYQTLDAVIRRLQS